MTAIEILEDLKDYGYKIRIDGDDLVINGKQPIGASLIETLRENKPEIIEYLTSVDREFTAQISGADLSEKWENYLLERVGILTKFEGYTIEAARDEVVKMIPYYLRLN